MSLNDLSISSISNNKSSDNSSSEIIDFIEDNNSNTFEEYYKESQNKKLFNAINSLPEDLKEICGLLKYKNATEVSRELNISRATLYRKIHEIKEVFIKTGVDNDWEL